MMTQQLVRRGLRAMARRLPATLPIACILAMVVVLSAAPRADALSWAERSPSPKPSARRGHAMVSVGGDQVLLFGGWDGSRDGETWVYDLSENTWTLMSPAAKPSARENHAMASLGGDQVLLFGGDDGSWDDETWVYDLGVNNWTRIVPAIMPSVRYCHAMASLGGDQVLLFGGYDSLRNDETWV